MIWYAAICEYDLLADLDFITMFSLLSYQNKQGEECLLRAEVFFKVELCLNLIIKVDISWNVYLT